MDVQNPINESVWETIYQTWTDEQRPALALTPAGIEQAARPPLEDEVIEAFLEGEKYPYFRIINHVDLDEETE